MCCVKSFSMIRNGGKDARDDSGHERLDESLDDFFVLLLYVLNCELTGIDSNCKFICC